MGASHTFSKNRSKLVLGGCRIRVPAVDILCTPEVCSATLLAPVT